MRNFTKAAVVVGSTAAIIAAVAGPASAEPPPAATTSSYVAVGSDTLQGVYDQFQADYTATPNLVSYDAFGTSTITPKPGCASITRPNGSGAGITAIATNAQTGDGHYCVNIARSSRTKASTDPAGLSWVTLAEDGVSWAADADGNAPENLTAAQLFDIYSCNVTTWDEVGGDSTDTIVPVLPQASSGTRSFFLSALNASQHLSGSLVPGNCVDTTTSPEENEGVNPIFTGDDQANIVYPYSAAVYAAQVYNDHATTASNPGNLTIRDIDGVAPVTSSATPATLNIGFPVDFQRKVYSVIRTAAETSSTTPDGNVFAALVGPSGFLCSSSELNQLAEFGFGTAACGNVDTRS